jgi:hypothetical protein
VAGTLSDMVRWNGAAPSCRRPDRLWQFSRLALLALADGGTAFQFAWSGDRYRAHCLIERKWCEVVPPSLFFFQGLPAWVRRTFGPRRYRFWPRWLGNPDAAPGPWQADLEVGGHRLGVEILLRARPRCGSVRVRFADVSQAVRQIAVESHLAICELACDNERLELDRFLAGDERGYR